MLVKEAVYKEVTVKQNQQVEPPVYGCDCCGKELVEYPNETNRLELTVFHNNSEKTEHLHFCSWRCVLKQLPKIKTDYFIDLPFLYYDEKEGKGRTAKEFIKLIKELKL